MSTRSRLSRKGSLVHEILERFIRHVDEQGSLPEPGDQWSAEHRDVLRRVAEAGFADAESRVASRASRSCGKWSVRRF